MPTTSRCASPSRRARPHARPAAPSPRRASIPRRATRASTALRTAPTAVSGATARSLADAMMLDQSPCSVCWSSQSSPTTPPSVNLPEQVYSFEVGTSGIQVYSLLTDAYYHTNSTCSGRTGLVQVALETAAELRQDGVPGLRFRRVDDRVFLAQQQLLSPQPQLCRRRRDRGKPTPTPWRWAWRVCPYCVTGSAEGGGEVPVYPEPGNLVPGTSGIYVYASADGDHYHLSADDAGSGAIRVALETALNYGKSACPDCCPIGDATVYATPGGRYFHANQSHADDDSVGLTCALALSLGLEPCPTCFSSGQRRNGRRDHSRNPDRRSGIRRPGEHRGLRRSLLQQLPLSQRQQLLRFPA